MSGSQASLPLFPAPRPAPRSGQDTLTDRPRAAQRRQLWLALDCYQLPLEVFADAPGRVSVAVLEGDGHGARICRCNNIAAAQGIVPGLPLNAALALCPELQILQRDVRREIRHLRRLAHWAMQYTSLVSLEKPQRLLLELQGSLKLFGGLEALSEQICSGLDEFGYSVRHAVAPTPRAALWLAKATQATHITDFAALPGVLGRLPLSCTDWSRRECSALEGMGVQTLGDCMRLPRDGFTRRLGVRCLADLDRALGHVAEPRQGVSPPVGYRGSIELPEETFDRGMISYGMCRLLDEMALFLRRRQAGVQRPEFVFRHNSGDSTRFPFGLAEPTADAAFLAELLSPRLEQACLHAPVVSLSLHSGMLTPLPGSLQRLELDTGAGQRSQQDVCRLVDRLRARLGTDAVTGLCLLAEHRPEAAWDYAEPGTRCAAIAGRARPLWILQAPRLLTTRAAQPWMDGPLQLRRGPERIESGWWDGKDVSRDYYEALSSKGMSLWIFRERREPRCWFLHGVFG
ncbi:MAG: DNA polymerase Y family protein [Gammaproteobacteria bacterium]